MATVVFAGTVAAAWLVLPDDSHRYWFHTFFDRSRIAPDWHPANQSVRGALARLTRSPEAPVWLWLLVAGLVGALGLVVAVRLYRRDERLLAAIVCGLTSAMVSPFSWSHHWVWFVPLTVYLIHRALASDLRWWLAAAALYVVTASWVYRFPDSNPVVGFYLWPAAPPLGDLLRNLYPLIYLPILAMAAVIARRAGAISER